jgi:hypothetical protein
MCACESYAHGHGNLLLLLLLLLLWSPLLFVAVALGCVGLLPLSECYLRQILLAPCCVWLSLLLVLPYASYSG